MNRLNISKSITTLIITAGLVLSGTGVASAESVDNDIGSTPDLSEIDVLKVPSEEAEVADIYSEDNVEEQNEESVEESEDAVEALKVFEKVPTYRWLLPPLVGRAAQLMDDDGWLPKPKVTFEWSIDGKVIPNEITSSLMMLPEYGGRRLTVKATGTLEGYQETTVIMESTVAELSLTGVVGKSPSMSGRFIVGGVITASEGSWSAPLTGGKVAYQWLRDGKAINGATGRTYKIAAGDLGKKISVRVTPTLIGYKSVSAVSPARSVVKKFTTTPRPSVAGSLEVGQTLTAGAGKWVPAFSSVSYQWYRNGSAINGATKSKYKTTGTDIGKKVSVQVTGARSGYETWSVRSTDRTILNRIGGSVSAPTGELFSGRYLNAKPGFTVTGLKYKYQWLRDGKVIKGAVSSKYKITKADRGRKLSYKVTASKSGYSSRTVASKHVTAHAAWFDDARVMLDRMGGKDVKLEYSNRCEKLRAGTEACTSRGIIYLTKHYKNSKYSKGWIMSHEMAHQYQFKVWDKLKRSKRFQSIFRGDLEYLANAMAHTRGHDSRAWKWTKTELDYARGVYQGRV